MTQNEEAKRRNLVGSAGEAVRDLPSWGQKGTLGSMRNKTLLWSSQKENYPVWFQWCLARVRRGRHLAWEDVTNFPTSHETQKSCRPSNSLRQKRSGLRWRWATRVTAHSSELFVDVWARCEYAGLARRKKASETLRKPAPVRSWIPAYEAELATCRAPGRALVHDLV